MLNKENICLPQRRRGAEKDEKMVSHRVRKEHRANDIVVFEKKKTSASQRLSGRKCFLNRRAMARLEDSLPQRRRGAEKKQLNIDACSGV